MARPATEARIRKVTDAVKALCAARGLKLTRSREQVLALLIRGGGSSTAYELIASLTEQTGKRVGPPTVYRALDFLLDIGAVTRVESRNAYAVCAHLGEDHQCIFFLCRECGKASEYVDPGIEALVDKASGLLGFTPDRRVIEIEGVCDRCRGAAVGTA